MVMTITTVLDAAISRHFVHPYFNVARGTASILVPSVKQSPNEVDMLKFKICPTIQIET